MTRKVDCPHCGKPYLPRGLNTHIGRMHKEERIVANPVGKRAKTTLEVGSDGILRNYPEPDRIVVTVEEREFPQEMVKDSDPKPIPTAEGATYTKWQRFQNWIRR